uniref:Uncharacterized protein n=1 Tax=Arundo donax TaxID=35708 RepID=A0A0A9GH58_ARUDO
MNSNMQIIILTGKEKASIIQSVRANINKLLYLHNQMQKKKQNRCKMVFL